MTRPWLIAPLTAAALFAVLLAACGPSVPPPPDSIGTPINHTLPAAIRALPLVDDTGKPISLAAYRGKVVVVSDTMTLCQETCPLDTANVVQTARAVEHAGFGDQVEFASITVDPDRDTPTRLAAYRHLFDPAPADWTLLTGAPGILAQLWKQLGVYWQKVPEDNPPGTDWLTGKPLSYDINHSDLIFFFDRNGHERFVIDGAGDIEPGTQVPATLRGFLSDQGQNNLAHPEPGSWTAPQALQVISWLTQRQIPSRHP
jgi:protein SCO1/2